LSSQFQRASPAQAWLKPPLLSGFGDLGQVFSESFVPEPAAAAAMWVSHMNTTP
jgi:hypothetical protein